MSRWIMRATSVVSSVLLAGCSVARRPHVEPAIASPSHWSREAATTRSPDPARLARWWVTFGDPELTQTLEQIAVGNLDVKTAVSRLRVARAEVAVARSARMPIVSAGASGSVSHTSTEVRGGVESDDDLEQSYSLGADATWELDVFGRRGAESDAASAAAGAVSFDLADVLTSALADGAALYVDVCTLQERMRLAAQNARMQTEALEIAQFRVQAGLTTELDVYQARTNLANTRAQIAALELALAQRRHALSILQGANPASATAGTPPSASGGIPSPPDDVAIGVPAEALRRRPDVRAAERRIAERAARGDAARARLYPTFSLAGSIGLEALKLARLFVPGAGAFRVTPAVTWAAFDRRQLTQQVVIADEQTRQAAINYEAVVLRALQEVEDALAAFALEQVRRDRLQEAVTAAQRTVELATQRYTTGLRDFRDVLDAQRSLVTLQDQLASSHANVSIAVVGLYRAIGGGWVPLPRP